MVIKQSCCYRRCPARRQTFKSRNYGWGAPNTEDIGCPVESRQRCVLVSNQSPRTLSDADKEKRIEYHCAVLSTRLAKGITQALSVSKTVFWTDSSYVCYWVCNTGRNFKPFVANCISEIHDTTDPEQWRHVPGEVNPADLPTRGLLVSELIKSKLWLEGPDFLQAQESSWPEKLPKPRMPENAEVLEKNLEQRTHLTDQAEKANVQTEETTDHADRLAPTRFSSYSRLLHVTGWVCRFITNCQSAKDSRESSKFTYT